MTRLYTQAIGDAIFKSGGSLIVRASKKKDARNTVIQILVSFSIVDQFEEKLEFICQ
jgi:hypothetical protein